MTLDNVLEKLDVWEEIRASAVVLLAAAAVEVETILEAEVKADLEASVTEDENDMACKRQSVGKIIDQLLL